ARRPGPRSTGSPQPVAASLVGAAALAAAAHQGENGFLVMRTTAVKGGSRECLKNWTVWRDFESPRVHSRPLPHGRVSHRTQLPGPGVAISTTCPPWIGALPSLTAPVPGLIQCAWKVSRVADWSSRMMAPAAE